MAASVDLVPEAAPQLLEPREQDHPEQPVKSKPKLAGGGSSKLVVHHQPKLSFKAAASQIAPAGAAKQSSSSTLNTASVVSHVAHKATEELRYKTVADDPNAREAYKSLFLSGAKDEPKNKAHWVTYFPYH